jgi:hypothetical protein
MFHAVWGATMDVVEDETGTMESILRDYDKDLKGADYIAEAKCVQRRLQMLVAGGWWWRWKWGGLRKQSNSAGQGVQCWACYSVGGAPAENNVRPAQVSIATSSEKSIEYHV